MNHTTSLKDWQNKETTMSRFKFRVWDGETFYYFDLNDPEKISLDYLETFLRLPNKQQCTGLFDGDREVWEGDSFFYGGTEYIVQWHEDRFLLVSADDVVGDYELSWALENGAFSYIKA